MLSVFSLVPDLLLDCSRVLEYAKIRTVLEVALPQKKNQAKKEGGQKEQQHLQMGLCVSGERADFEGVVRYNGQTFLGVRHGEGTYLYKNGDMYTGQWKWNHKHGHGVLMLKNGEK